MAFRYLRLDNFLEDQDFIASLAEDPQQARVNLEDALSRCLERNTLIKATLELESGPEEFYFLNTPKGRAAVGAIERGEWQHSGDLAFPVDVISESPGIYHSGIAHVYCRGMRRFLYVPIRGRHRRCT